MPILLQTGGARDCAFGDVFSNNLDFECHFGSQWIWEGGQQTVLLVIMLKKTRKRGSRNASRKNKKFIWILDAKMRGLERSNRAFRTVPVAKYEFSVVSKFDGKVVPKWLPKWIQNGALGAPGIVF